LVLTFFALALAVLSSARASVDQFGLRPFLRTFKRFGPSFFLFLNLFPAAFLPRACVEPFLGLRARRLRLETPFSD